MNSMNVFCLCMHFKHHVYHDVFHLIEELWCENPFKALYPLYWYIQHMGANVWESFSARCPLSFVVEIRVSVWGCVCVCVSMCVSGCGQWGMVIIASRNWEWALLSVQYFRRQIENWRIGLYLGTIQAWGAATWFSVFRQTLFLPSMTDPSSSLKWCDPRPPVEHESEWQCRWRPWTILFVCVCGGGEDCLIWHRAGWVLQIKMYSSTSGHWSL